MFRYQPPEPEKIVKVIRSGFATKREDETAKRLGKAWFPLNQDNLKHIKQQFLIDESQDEREQLVEKIKGDPALFMHCARSLIHHLDIPPAGFSPIQVLREIDYAQLKTILNFRETEVSSHRFKNMTKPQALRLQRTLISTHASEALAKRMKINSDSAFSAAALRELGYELIAWNYPTLYSELLVASRKSEVNFEMALKRFLGVSPFELSLRYANEWDLNAEIKTVLSPPPKPDRFEGSDPDKIDLRSICEISELYAELQDNLNYPQAQKKWSEKEARFSKLIDLKSLDQVKDHVQDILTHYEGSATVVVSLPLVKEVHAKDKPKDEGLNLLEINPYAHKCSEDIKEKFLKVYNLIEESKVSVEALKYLVDYVIPELGFTKGCLYLLQPNTRELKPVLRIGDGTLTEYSALIHDPDNGVISTPYGSVLYKNVGRGIDGTTVNHLSSGLESPRHFGLLYLEIAEREEVILSTENLFLYFHAVRKALNDCVLGYKTGALGQTVSGESG